MSDGKPAVATRRAAMATIGAAVLGTVAACKTGGEVTWHQAGEDVGGSPSSSPSAQPLALTILPAETADVQPGVGVTVTAENGTVTAVTVTSSGGTAIKGKLSDDHTTWTSTSKIRYNTTYKVAASATNANGEKVNKSTSFKTAKPSNFTRAYLRQCDTVLLDGGTFGVAQPIVVWWDEQISDRAAAEKAFEVISEPAQEGAWRWVSADTMHWRPKEYWQTGTKVTVNANIYGMHFGKGLYGEEDRTASFTISDSKRVAIADSNTKHMLVYIDGKLVRDIPISMGKGGTTTGSDGQVIDFWTRTGVHVVMDHQPEVRMWSGSYGITDKSDPNFYDEKILLAVHISYAGEYVHLADWNIPKQGHINSSHGCINVGPSHAKWFYDTFKAGDIVEVKNTPKKLAVTDGLGDWTLTWEQWTAPA
jgi:lipoprotein-anchoring transpeptidase ErfK/SrfK